MTMEKKKFWVVGHAYKDSVGAGVFYLCGDNTCSFGLTHEVVTHDNLESAQAAATVANRPGTNDNWTPREYWK